MPTIDGIINEPTVNFVGKDGFFWWVGEVEDNEDPMGLWVESRLEFLDTIQT